MAGLFTYRLVLAISIIIGLIFTVIGLFLGYIILFDSIVPYSSAILFVFCCCRLGTTAILLFSKCYITSQSLKYSIMVESENVQYATSFLSR